MIRLRLRGVTVRLSVLFFAGAALLLTLDRSGAAAWGLAAALVHELGHFLALAGYGRLPASVTLGVFGVCVRQNPARPLGYGRAAAVSLAGPAANLLTGGALYLAGAGGTAVLAHGVMGVLNLLPIEPLDGGQALRALLCMRMEERTAYRAVRAVSVCALLPLATLGFLLLLRSGGNVSLLLLCGYLAGMMLWG